jgi:renalase
MNNHYPTDKTIYDLIVIGAGISGLTAATIAKKSGRKVCVIDKAPTAGGRMATRFKDETHWDHGAQYFTVKSAEFMSQIDDWQQQNLVAPWRAAFAVWDGEQLSMSRPRDRYIGTPSMKSPLEFMASHLDIFYKETVTQIEYTNELWRVSSAEKIWHTSQLLIAIPAAQSANLLRTAIDAEKNSEKIHTQVLRDLEQATQLATESNMEPCWALLLNLKNTLQLPFAAAFINHGNLAWVAQNNSKLSRPAGFDFVLHANPHWSKDYLEADRAWVEKTLFNEFNQLIKRWTGTTENIEVSSSYLHLWRYARAQPIERAADQSAFASVWPSIGLALAGDWLGDARIEGAYLSGLNSANQLLGIFDHSMHQDSFIHRLVNES